MDALWIGIISALAGGLAGFVPSFASRLRDEGRQGGAAENLLHSDLLRAARMVRAMQEFPGEGDTKDLEVPSWTTQWDRLATRFNPLVLDRIGRTVDALRYLRRALNNDAEDAGKLEVSRAEVERSLDDAIAILDARRILWLEKKLWLRPYRNPSDGELSPLIDKAMWEERRSRRLLWAIAGGLALVCASVATAVAVVVIDGDPISASTAEGELREMAPEASTVNCTGDDSEDRWTCLVVTGGCELAQADSGSCPNSAQREERYDVNGDSETDTISAFLIRDALRTGGSSSSETADPEPSSPRRRGWIGRIGRDDSAASQTGSVGTPGPVAVAW